MKKFLSLILALTLLAFAFPAYAGNVTAVETRIYTISFSSVFLAAGDMSADVTLISTSSEDAVVTLNYYHDGSVALFDSEIVTLTALKQTSVTLRLTIPDSASAGDCVKVLAMAKTTLKPYTAQSDASLIISSGATAYDGLSERYYTLDSDSGSVALTGTSSRTLAVSENGSLLRLKDMGEGEYAFENGEKSSDRLKASDGSAVMGMYLPGSASERWTLEESGSGYALKSVSEGKYLAIAGDSVTLSDSPFTFTLTLAAESPSTLMTGLPGFAALTEAQQKRICEIFTSVGANVFPQSTSGKTTYLTLREASIKTLIEASSSMTDEEQAKEIIDIFSEPLFGSNASGLADWYNLSTLPETEDTEIIQSDPVATKHEIWDLCGAGETVDCYVIEVTYKTASTSQTIDVYATDPDYVNVQSAIDALALFPYSYRKALKNMYVYYSTGNTYNCGGEEMFVRVSSELSTMAAARGFAHELGHSMDMTANGNLSDSTTHWCQGEKWQTAVADDIVTVSTYGNTNYYEGIAEFSRLYISSYGDRDRQLAMEQLFPNQIASFNRMLKKVGGPVLYGNS